MTITIVRPHDRQIYQRDENNVADITISGTYTGSPTAIEASFNGGAYATIAASPSGGVFSGTLSNQPAGQGTLTVRFTNVPATLDTATNVGVGDVFLVAGQSNAAGYGTNSQSYTHPTLKASVWRVGASAWAELTDPASAGADGSSWPLLATLHMASQGVPVAFVTTGVTSTGLNSTGEWMRGGSQYRGALETLANSGVNGVKAILWYQGETEVNQADINPTGKTQAYQNALSQMLDGMQADSPVLAGVKMVAAQIGYKTSSGSTRVGIDPIRLAQSGIWELDPDILAGPLLYDIDLSDGDGVHIGQGADGDAELLTAARRWWRMLAYHFYGGTQGRAPRFSHAARNGTAVTVVFDASIPMTGIAATGAGWRFTDDGSPITVTSAKAVGDNLIQLELASEPTGTGKISYGSGNDAAGVGLLDIGTYALPPEPFVDEVAAPITDDGDFEFFVDIEDRFGNKLGSGPLTTVSQWTYTARFDRAGSIAFSFSASDAQAAAVTNRCIARAWARLNGVRVEVGAGVVDALEIANIDNNGHVTYAASGLDLTRELSYRGVGTLEIGAGSGATHAQGVDALEALAPDGWTFIPASDPGNDYIYARYDGESVLGAAVALADKTGTHFYRPFGRTLVFAGGFTPSGVRAIQADGDLAPETCAITSLSRAVDTHDLLTRIYPYGSGVGRTRLTLAATTRTAPVGYTLNKTLNYIENDAATAAYGLIEHPVIEFKEITPIANTAANVRGAANMLFDAALAELQWRSTLAAQETYKLTVAGCSQLLRPLQTLPIVYNDPNQGIDIDEELYILESTWQVDASGVRTTNLVVSTSDRWPESDVDAAAERAVQGRVFQAHPQLGPNSYWENFTVYVGSSQADHVAEMPFVLGPEVAGIDRARFRFKVTEPLSFISVVAGALEVDFAVDVDDIDVSVSGTINISHTHPIPNHQHTTTVAGGTAPPDHLLVAVSGGTGFLTKASAGDVAVNTNAASGATTAESGGSASLALSGSGTGTGTGSGSVDLSSAIGVSYGVYRAPASRTYAMSDLEYAINGGAWVSLDTATATDDYYEIDITDEIQDPDTFLPLHENNLIEIRRKTDITSFAINSSQGNGSTVGISTSPVEHGIALGEQVIVTGTPDHDGVWLVVEVTNETVFRVNMSGDSNTNSPGVGTVTINKAAMILAKLGVVSWIQAIAYT